MSFLRNTRDSTLAQTGSENKMGKDTVASLDFSVHRAQYPRAHFLLTFIQSPGCRNFRPGTSHAFYACGRVQRKTCLRHSLSNSLSSSRFFFLPFKHSFKHSTSREHAPVSVLLLLPPFAPVRKIKFFSNWNSIEYRRGRNRSINSPHGTFYANPTKS